MAGSNAGDRRGNRIHERRGGASVPRPWRRGVGAQACANGGRAGSMAHCSCCATTTFARATTRPRAPGTRRRSRSCSRRSCRRSHDRDAFAAIDLALVLQHTGEGERAKALLDRSEAYFRTIPRMGVSGYGIADVAIHALRGDKAKALAALARGRAGRLASSAGATTATSTPTSPRSATNPSSRPSSPTSSATWRKQRARLAARPKDAPLELTDASR